MDVTLVLVCEHLSYRVLEVTATRSQTTPAQVLRSDSSAKIWFLDCLPVSPLFGYYLTASMGKFNEDWDDATVTLAVYAWKRKGQTGRPPPSLIEQMPSEAKRLLKFTAPIGSVIQKTNSLYNFNIGLVKIAEQSDLVVQVKIRGATQSRGTLVYTIHPMQIALLTATRC